MFSRLTILLATVLSCANSCHNGTSFPNTNPSKYFSISTCGSSCETVRQNQFNSVLRFDTNFFNSLIFVNSYIYIYSSSSVTFLINHPQLLCPLLRYLNLLLSSSSVLSSLSSLILSNQHGSYSTDGLFRQSLDGPNGKNTSQISITSSSRCKEAREELINPPSSYSFSTRFSTSNSNRCSVDTKLEQVIYNHAKYPKSTFPYNCW